MLWMSLILNRIRDTSDDPIHVKGEAWKTEIFITVEYYWLILPVVNVSLALMFLLAVMYQSHRHSIPVWKSSQSKMLTVLEPGAKHEIYSHSHQSSDVQVKLSPIKDGTWLLQHHREMSFRRWGP